MNIDDKIIDFIESETASIADVIERYNYHTPADGRVLAKLLYYQPSVLYPTEKKKPSNLILVANTENVFDTSKDKTYTEKDDGVIPFILILNGGNVDGVETGQLRQVSRQRVTGENFSPEFLAMADVLRKNKDSKQGQAIVDKAHTPEAKIASLEKYWGIYRIEAPWYTNVDMKDGFIYELPPPEVKGVIDVKTLKSKAA